MNYSFVFSLLQSKKVAWLFQPLTLGPCGLWRLKASPLTEETVQGQPGRQREAPQVWGWVGGTMAEQDVPQVQKAHDGGLEFLPIVPF